MTNNAIGESELYTRQSSLGLNVPASATVVGTGGVGAWVATFLAMSGVRKLYLYDPDSLEPSNFNRVPLSPSRSGESKVKVLREWLIQLRPKLLVIASQIRISPVVLPKTDILFDCTDAFEVRKPLYRFCQENKVRYVRAGYDGGEHISVSGTLPWVNGEPGLGRYTIVPSWVVPAVLCAAIAVYSAICPTSVNGTISCKIEDLIKESQPQTLMKQGTS